MEMIILLSIREFMPKLENKVKSLGKFRMKNSSSNSRKITIVVKKIMTKN